MTLRDKRVAVLAEDLFEDIELLYPYYRLREAGAQVTVVGAPGAKTHFSKHEAPIEVDAGADTVSVDDFDALVIPGGYAPDRMRRHPEMVDLVRRMNDKGAVIAMICHAGWLPISAGILRGKRATSFFSIKDDMVNAGVQWVDEPAVVDGNLISARSPDDLPQFCTALIAALK